MTVIFETLCRCGDLRSDHVTTGPWTENQMPEFGPTPCGKCNRTLEVLGMTLIPACTGFDVWPDTDMPIVGSAAAVVLGCTCPQREAECPLHVWICKYGRTCDHTDDTLTVSADGRYTIDHHGRHWSCEHCTVPRIECRTCGKVWFDWRVKAEQCGWVEMAEVYKTQGVGPSTLTPMNIKSTWRCATCVQTT